MTAASQLENMPWPSRLWRSISETYAFHSHQAATPTGPILDDMGHFNPSPAEDDKADTNNSSQDPSPQRSLPRMESNSPSGTLHVQSYFPMALSYCEYSHFLESYVPFGIMLAEATLGKYLINMYVGYCIPFIQVVTNDRLMCIHFAWKCVCS